MTDDAFIRVQQIIAELAAAKGYEGTLSATRPLRDVGFDSLLTVQLVARLEDELGVEFPDEALTPGSFATLGSTLDVVRPLL